MLRSPGESEEAPMELFVFLIPAVVILVLLAGSVFWIWMLVECVTKEPNEGNDRIVWLLIILFLHFIGAQVCFFVRRPERLRLTGR